MRRIRLALAALVTALLAVVVPAAAAAPSSAAALPVLSRTAPGGPPALPGDSLVSSLTPGTSLNFSTVPGGPFGLFCKQSTWNGQVMANPPAPGTAAIKLLNPFTISSCFDNSPTVTGVVGVTVGNLPATMTADPVKSNETF